MEKGKAQEILALAKDFAETSAAQQRADFVTKENEPGDVGIQGRSADPSTPGAAIPLDEFRDSVKRSVFVQRKKNVKKNENPFTYA